MTDLPVPVIDDADTEGFWRAAASGRVQLRRCDACGAVLHLPKAYCHRCGGWETSWHDVRPSGRIYSWTTTHRELRPGFTPPYTVILVELDDAPEARLVGYLPGEPDLAVGMPVAARFEQRGDATLVQWVPA
jgi:uncharacterized protein